MDISADVHGWDFIGGLHGDINHENLELTRLIRAGKADSAMIAEYNQKINDDKETVNDVENFIKILDSIAFKINRDKIDKDTPELADFQNYKPQNNFEERVRSKAIEVMNDGMDYTTYQAKLKDYKKPFSG